MYSVFFPANVVAKNGNDISAVASSISSYGLQNQNTCIHVSIVKDLLWKKKVNNLSILTVRYLSFNYLQVSLVLKNSLTFFALT